MRRKICTPKNWRKHNKRIKNKVTDDWEDEIEWDRLIRFNTTNVP